MRKSPEEIKKRFQKCDSRKSQWRDIYEDAYKYALPQRNLYDGHYEGNTPGQNKMNRVFDSTAIHSTHRFANRIQSGIFPPGRPFCRLVPGEDIPEERAVEVQRVLDEYAKKMFDVMRQSAFDQAMGEFLLELAVGTSVMLVQPGDEINPIRYTAVPTFLICFEEGPFGRVDTVYRRLKRSFNVLEQEFPDIQIPTSIRQKFQDDETKEIELIEATYYSKEAGVYYYSIVDFEGTEMLLNRTLKSFPWIISRFSKISGEIYGRGPLLSALPDIRTINRTKELTLKNASLTIGGVFTAADDGILNPNSIQIVPGAIIPVARNGGPQGESLRPLPRTGDPQLSQMVINDLRMNIKQMLFDESLPPDNMSARSATEIAERMKELAQNLGSAFGRLINETMYPVIRRTLELMDEMGMIELPLKVNGLEVKVIPNAPLAMAQNLEKVQEVLNYMQIVQGMGPVGQMAVRQDKVLEYIADQMNIPAELRTTPEEKMEIQKQMMEMMQQQQAQMEAQGGEPGTQDQVN